MGLIENLEELERRNAAAELGGGEERIAKQHEAGKMTARERVDVLLDRGSFGELEKFHNDSLELLLPDMQHYSTTQYPKY